MCILQKKSCNTEHKKLLTWEYWNIADNWNKPKDTLACKKMSPLKKSN